jgi:malonate transporter and related proteins
MSALFQYFLLAAPLFAIVLTGYLLAKLPGWRQQWSGWASKVVFNAALPLMLFHVMSGLRSMPPIDPAVLIAFFGGCLLIFGMGRLLAARLFKMDGVAQSVFAMGGIFSNNVLLGLPLVKITLGPTAVPAAALVIVFNAFTLWTLVSVCIEWSKHGAFTVKGMGKTAWNIITSPLVAGIVSGTVFGLSGLTLPTWTDRTLDVVSEIAGPGALLVLGMGMVQYGLSDHRNHSVAISAIKLVAMPLTVWLLAALLGLPPLQTQAIVVLASMSTGANVYLMSMQFGVLQGAVAGAIVISTAVAAITTPVILAAMAAVMGR